MGRGLQRCLEGRTTTPPPAPLSSTAARIARLEAALAAARQEQRQEQRQELVAAIATVVGSGIIFSAAELWQHQVLHPVLRIAFTEARIHSPKQLGKKLRQCCGYGLTRRGEDRSGVLWTVEVRDELPL